MITQKVRIVVTPTREGGSGDLEGASFKASRVLAVLYFLTSPRVISWLSSL